MFYELPITSSDLPLRDEGKMFAIGIYIAGLTLVLLASIVATRNISPAEMTIVILPLLYLILEMREELGRLQVLNADLTRNVVRARCRMQ
jgi:hypothetical protein